ncbi:MAG: hypothetical protein ABEI86_11060 [Halobacteriaceae archaeon]
MTFRDEITYVTPSEDQIEEIHHEKVRTDMVSPSVEPADEKKYYSFSDVPEDEEIDGWDNLIIVTDKHVIYWDHEDPQIENRGLIERVASKLCSTFP